MIRRAALAIAASLTAAGPFPAPAQTSPWVISAKEGECRVSYLSDPDDPSGAAAMHSFGWTPGAGIAWMIVDRAPPGAKADDPIPMRVTTASGVRLEGEGEHAVSDGVQSYSFTTADRKDAALMVSGDLTYAYTDESRRAVSFTVPLGQQLPRIRNCFSEARAQARTLSASGASPERATRSRDGDAPELRSTGSGFFVNAAGQLLTNAHVVDGCGTVGNRLLGAGKLLAVDEASDLALLQFTGRPRAFVSFRPTGLRLGESVLAAGFPLSTVLENGLNVTGGNVSALAGQGGDRRFVQFTAPVQPGNSGGPLLDAHGRVAGVVVARLDPETAARAAAQNINYAVAPFVVQAFLNEHDIKFSEGRESRETSETIASKAKAYTVPLECWG